MSARSRRRQHRRDRRKAKASGWNRPGKTNMGGRVGHGASGSRGGPSEAGLALKPVQSRIEVAQPKPKHQLRVALADLARRK